MKTYVALVAASAIALAPSAILAKPDSAGHSMPSHSMPTHTMPTHAMPTQSTQTHTSQGSTHGKGWDHMNGPSTTGQPGVECGEGDALNRPGRAADAPGSAFNEDGKAHSVYAGEQPQNSRNTASVSQYDTACLHQPQR